MNELGMIVDVGHTGYQSTLDAIELSSRPIVFSHANCKALCDHPRNKTDDQIRALARKGGVMGLTCFNWFVSDKPRSTLADLLDHFDHVIKLVGPEHVGIGSDFGIPGWAGPRARRGMGRAQAHLLRLGVEADQGPLSAIHRRNKQRKAVLDDRAGSSETRPLDGRDRTGAGAKFPAGIQGGAPGVARDVAPTVEALMTTPVARVIASVHSRSHCWYAC